MLHGGIMSENSSSRSAATERDSIVLAVNIPPRPALYMALQHEIHKEEKRRIPHSSTQNATSQRCKTLSR